MTIPPITIASGDLSGVFAPFALDTWTSGESFSFTASAHRTTSARSGITVKGIWLYAVDTGN